MMEEGRQDSVEETSMIPIEKKGRRFEAFSSLVEAEDDPGQMYPQRRLRDGP